MVSTFCDPTSSPLRRSIQSRVAVFVTFIVSVVSRCRNVARAERNHEITFWGLCLRALLVFFFCSSNLTCSPKHMCGCRYRLCSQTSRSNIPYLCFGGSCTVLRTALQPCAKRIMVAGLRTSIVARGYAGRGTALLSGLSSSISRCCPGGNKKKRNMDYVLVRSIQ